jgi:elongation factor P
MDVNTYDQISVPKDEIGDLINFIPEGTEITILMYEEKPVSIIPPNFVELDVVYAEEGLKGDTATNATKEVELGTGAKIHVPLFVKKGDRVKVDLRDLSYVERIN